jgi:hypothetical protein
MSKQNAAKKINQSLQIRCISALRSARERFSSSEYQPQNIGELDELVYSVERLEHVLFSADTGKSRLLFDCFMDLIFVLKEMKNQFLDKDASMRPIGLQVATANNIIPIQLEWNYHNPNSLFVIEYANFEETNKPDWRIYSKTRSTSFTVRDLPQGRAYWFRISALAPAV